MEETRISLENEKYTFIIREDGMVECLRFGEPWVKFHEGSKALITLIHKTKESDLLDAAIELLIVASLRGDTELPHPSADSRHWTARMQTAWDELYQIVEILSPGKVDEGIITGRKNQKLASNV